MSEGQTGAGEGGAIDGSVLPQLFSRLGREQGTGVVTVTRPEGVSRAFFREGGLAGATVVGRFKPLGIFMLEAGIIDIQALDASLSIMSKAKVPQGKVLVDLGAIDAQQLEQGLHEQQLANVEAFLQQQVGDWSFEEASLPEWTGDILIEPEIAVLGACRDPAGRSLVRSLLEEIGSTRVKLKVEAAIVVDHFSLPAADARALRGLTGEVELDELVMAADIELQEILVLVAALRGFDLVEGVPGGGDILELLDDLDGARAVATEQVQPEAEEKAESAPSRPRSRRAGEAKDRARRSRLLKKAFQNIPGAQALTERRATASKKDGTPASDSSPDRKLDPAQEKERVAARARRAKGRETEASRAFTAEVARWHGSVGQEDFYRRLRIKRTATAGEVKAGYLALAKRFHPDRAQALSLDVEASGKLNVVFEAIKEAYDVLKEPDDRKRYDLRLQEGLVGGGEDRARAIAAARMQFRKGLVHFRKKDFEHALPLLGRAYKADPKNGEWAVTYAWAYFSVGPAEEVKDECIRILKRAAGGEEAQDRAYYYLGLLARIDGEFDRAERYLNRALRINDRLTEAATELRLIKRRMERETGTATSRFMRKILGD